MLELDSVNTFYGTSHVLHDVSLRAESEEVVAILGRNGAGKTTTLRSIMGLTPPRSGRISYNGEDLTGKEPHQISDEGIGFVPQERRLFPHLSVKENLTLGAGTDKVDEEQLEYIYQLFPRVEERAEQRAGTLSGGEQQMVAIARALVRHPELILFDEPTEGLMPALIPTIAETVRDLTEEEYTILLVEQKVELVLELSDRVYIMETGQIVDHATPAELRDDDETLERHLGV